MIKNTEKYRTADAVLIPKNIRKSVSPKAYYLYSAFLECGNTNLSTDELVLRSGLSKNSYYIALNELIDKGYIRKQQEHDNGRYSFVNIEIVGIKNND